MNTSEINLPLNVGEHEILLDAINSYYDVVCSNLPVDFENIMPVNDDYVSRFNALTSIRQKIVNNWSTRFDG